MRGIETSAIKMLVVTEPSGTLLRTVTDGDIRRGLLGGLDLNAPIDALPGCAPTSCPQNSSPDEIASILDKGGISAVVIVNGDNVPVGLVDRTSLNGMTLMSPPHIGSQEIEFVRAAFEDNWIAPAGPNLVQFERQLAAVSLRRHALALSSGTAALHLALRCLRVASGDRVYVSDLTFAASLQPILYENAVPVLIDSEPVSWNMSPEALERKLAMDAATGTLPRAIVLVHIYGQSADVARIIPIAERYDVPIVEDAAESLGASFANRPSGSHGLLAAFSFNGNKIITTSGGGALVGDDQELMDFARFLSTQGRDPVEHYQHSSVAYNYRMSNILAGIGLGQLGLLESRVAARRKVFQRYRDGLGDLAGVSFQEEIDGSSGNRWLTVVTLDPDRIALHPFTMMRQLRQSGIETRPGWKPMHLQPLCAGLEFEPHDVTAPVSSRLFFQSLCLPSGSSLKTEEQDRIIGRIRSMIEAD
ncbi:DegT/DnrJ/EryC1/StrS family aminotransferase [Tsuneonella sp. HG249]